MRITLDGVDYVAKPEFKSWPEHKTSCVGCAFGGNAKTFSCPRDSDSILLCVTESVIWIKDTPEALAEYVAERMTS